MPTAYHTFAIFATRAATQLLREPQLVALDCGMQLFAGALFGVLYRDVALADLPTAVFMLALALVSARSARTIGRNSWYV